MPNVSYPLDTTGISPDNLVQNELHTVTEVNDVTYNLLVPVFAPFYLDNQELVHVAQDGTERTLIPDVDYYASLPYLAASNSIGKMLYGAWSINTRFAEGTIKVQYQTLGDKWTADANYVLEVLTAKAYNPRTVVWDVLTNVQDLFPPINHDQNLQYVYDSGDFVEKLNRIAGAILQGGSGGSGLGYVNHFDNKDNPHETNKEQVGLSNVDNYATLTEAEVLGGTTDIDKHVLLSQLFRLPKLVDLLDHLLNKDNPHETDKAQVGLDKVENYSVVTQDEIDAQEPVNKYVLFKHLVDLGFFTEGPRVEQALNDHIADKENPHGVNKDQIGLSNVENLATATDTEVQAGELIRKLFTLSQLVQHPAIQALLQHAENKDNPHNTNKLQVGLGNVENYGTATDTEVIDRRMFDKHVLLRQLVQAGVFNIGPDALEKITLHMQDESNPHATDKTQVGLGNVANLRLATDEEVQARQPLNCYVTLKQLVAAAIFDTGTAAVEGLNAHLEDINNPHQTNKDQVGLGNVSNLPVATDTEVSERTRANKYITLKQLLEIGFVEELDAIVQAINAHEADRDNPHETNKAQVGLSDVVNLPLASVQDIIDRNVVNGYVNLANLVSDLNKLDEARAILSSHLQDKENPHGTNKAQIGLGNVEDLPLATLADVAERRSVQKYITLGQLIQTGVLQLADETKQALLDHKADESNPHKVTKAQVGLEFTPNLPLASDQEVQTFAEVDALVTMKQLMSVIKRYSGNISVASLTYLAQ